MFALNNLVGDAIRLGEQRTEVLRLHQHATQVCASYSL
jgi:hypothetical protein